MVHRNGFTLVELLVAIAVFALLSALGWKVFDYLHKVKQRNVIHEQNLANLQHAYQQILRDSIQTIAVSAKVNDSLQAALSLENGHLSFNKTGVTDPLQQGLSADERVEYVYSAEEKKLYRLKYSNLNYASQVQPLSSELLNQVDAFSITVLNPNPLERWPQTQDNTDLNAYSQLPRGLQVQLSVAGVEYMWIFSLLNTEHMQEQP